MHHIETLQSMNILVTRPSGLESSLCSDIERLGGKTFHFPVIKIVAPKDITSLNHAVQTIHSFDIAIFISPTAVTEASKHFDLSSLSLKIAAIGHSTASALKQFALEVEIIPEGNNSESLLDHVLLQSDKIKNKHIIIFKGEGGRNLLFETLTSRGAIVTDVNLYCRTIPTHYTPLSSEQINKTDVILVTSGEGINNLLEMTENKSELLQKQMIVPGSRCLNIAKQHGFNNVVAADNATNPAFIDALLKLTDND